MSSLARATIASVTVTAALAAFAVALAGPAGDGLQSFAQLRPIAAGLLFLDVASAVAFGFAIGRGATGPAGRSPAAESGRAPAEAAAIRSQADSTTRAETEFLANMSHELRTPLNAVIGFAELILSQIHGTSVDRRYLDYARHIRTGGEQLLAIIDATLDLSQLAAGQVDLQPHRVEPRALVEECARSVAAQAEAARVELVVRPSTAPPVMVDPDRFKQALTGLLSNAIKFNRQGGRVSIGVTGSGDAVAFEVADTGIGMTPAQVAVALQPFRTIEGPMTRAHGGIGLGLPLAEHLVRLHGGELRIDSRPGFGTAVTAIVPAGGSGQTGER